MRGEAVNAVQGQHVRGARELCNSGGELTGQGVDILARNRRGEGATHLGEGAVEQVGGVGLVREHALEEGGVFGDGGTHHFGEERRGLADLGRDFGEGGEGFVRVGEEAVQHSSQSSEWSGLRSILDATHAQNLYPESVPRTQSQ